MKFTTKIMTVENQKQDSCLLCKETIVLDYHKQYIPKEYQARMGRTWQVWWTTKHKCKRMVEASNINKKLSNYFFN